MSKQDIVTYASTG